MIRRRFLTVSRTNSAHTNSSMPDLNKQANKDVPPVPFRGRLRVPRGLCLCVTCQTSFGGTRTGHADHHVETNGVKLFVGLEREFCSYPSQGHEHKHKHKHIVDRVYARFACRAVYCTYFTVCSATAASSSLQCSAAQYPMHEAAGKPPAWDPITREDEGGRDWRGAEER